MWQSITAFFGSQVASFGGIGLKIWQIALTVIVVIAGTTGGVFYLSYSLDKNQQSATAQNVIVLVGGLNTYISSGSCTVGGFTTLVSTLQSTLHFSNPYDSGCPPTRNMNSNPINLAYFSYLGGTMNSQTGVWKPKPYTRCAPDSTSLVNDDTTFYDMLYAYRTHYPNAHFTIIGHSLGGLVALTGATDIVDHFGPNIIDKVITIDSPLHGVPDKMWSGEFSDGNSECIFWTGPVIQSLNAVYKNQNETKLDVSLLEGKGTSVYTLGNDADCLYQNIVFCTPGILKSFGVTSFLNDGQTQYEASAFTRTYHIPEAISSLVKGEVPGHGAILSNAAALKDLTRFVLAPNISITQPKPNSTFWSAAATTPLSFRATVHCDWGVVNQAIAWLDEQGYGSPFFAGTSVPTHDPATAELSGVVNFPLDATTSNATFFVDGSGDACRYPAHTPSLALPEMSDYLGGITTGVTVSFDGGKIAVGTGGQVYAGKPSGGTIASNTLDYSQYNQGPGSNSIQDVAWSPDRTRLAYLVQTSMSYGDTISTSANLYVASSSLAAPKLLTANLPNAVALTWNATDDKIAILEETEGHNGPGPGGFFFTPSIVIVDASTGIGRQHINLPASANTFVVECGENCLTPRVRIQRGANGIFLLGYGNVGSTLATTSGQAQELATAQNLFRDSASLGAMNQQGTLIANPDISSSGQINVDLYQVNAASGRLGSPTTLTSFSLQNSTGNATADFSPDGTKIAICAGQKVMIASVQQPVNVHLVATLPSNSDGTSLKCENLRWNPDGQSLVIQIVGYGVQADGLAILPLSHASPPQVLFGCNLSYTTAFQYSENSGTTCNAGEPIFAVQPDTHNQSGGQVSSPSNADNNSKLLAQSPSLTVNAGNPFDVYFDYENTGKSTWTDANGFTLGCDQHYMPASNCMSGMAQGLNGAQVAPGEQSTFYLSLTAPTKPGTYQTAWDMQDKGSIFGQNHVFVTVNVTASVQQAQTLTTVDWANFTYTSSCYTNTPQQFTVHNGTATVGMVTFGVDPPIFGDLTGDGQPEAVILYSCIAADSFGPHVLVYSGTAAHPVLLADLPSLNETLVRVDLVKIVNGMLQLSGKGYALGDASCCLSLQVTTTYKWNGTQFVIVNSTSTKTS
jgi:hypothetical protein